MAGIEANSRLFLTLSRLTCGQLKATMRVPASPPEGAMEAVLLIQALIILALLNKFVL